MRRSFQHIIFLLHTYMYVHTLSNIPLSTDNAAAPVRLHLLISGLQGPTSTDFPYLWPTPSSNIIYRVYSGKHVVENCSCRKVLDQLLLRCKGLGKWETVAGMKNIDRVRIWKRGVGRALSSPSIGFHAGWWLQQDVGYKGVRGYQRNGVMRCIDVSCPFSLPNG